MFSPVKAITAGALVFAVGGLLLIAQPFDQPGVGVPGAQSTGDDGGFTLTVVEELGSESFVHVTTEHQGEPLVLVVRAEGETSIKRGDNVQVAFKGPVHVFAASGERIGD